MATRVPKTFQATARLGRNQERVLLPGATFNLWEGSIRAGKTYVSVLAFLIAVANLDDESATGGQLVIIGKNLGSIYRNFFRMIEDSPDSARSVVPCRTGRTPRPRTSSAARCRSSARTTAAPSRGSAV